MINNQAILNAIDDLNSQEIPNLAATAKKYDIVRSTLQRRFKSQTVTYAETRFRSTILFTNAQKSVFIKHINKLLTRNMHLIF